MGGLRIRMAFADTRVACFCSVAYRVWLIRITRGIIACYSFRKKNCKIILQNMHA